MPKLILYTTDACHLCKEAELLLGELAKTQGLEVETIDISLDEKLVSLYGIRIPVVKNPATDEEIGWPFGLSELASLF